MHPLWDGVHNNFTIEIRGGQYTGMLSYSRYEIPVDGYYHTGYRFLLIKFFVA